MANGRSNHPMYRNGGGGYDDDSGSDQGNYHAMSAQQMEHRRDEEFARQDAALDQIHRGVKGLRNQANAINDEVQDQNKVLDDINDRMDGAQDDLEAGTSKAREVNAKKAKVCKMYGVIAVLVTTEVVLTLVGVKFF